VLLHFWTDWFGTLTAVGTSGVLSVAIPAIYFIGKRVGGRSRRGPPCLHATLPYSIRHGSETHVR
jgi:hypothetical protein